MGAGHHYGQRAVGADGGGNAVAIIVAGYHVGDGQVVGNACASVAHDDGPGDRVADIGNLLLGQFVHFQGRSRHGDGSRVCSDVGTSIGTRACVVIGDGDDIGARRCLTPATRSVVDHLEGDVGQASRQDLPGVDHGLSQVHRA